MNKILSKLMQAILYFTRAIVILILILRLQASFILLNKLSDPITLAILECK